MSPASEQPQPDERQEGALAAIRAHPVVVGLITLIAVGASLLFLALRSSEYEATAELLVEPIPAEDQIFLGLPLLRDTGDPVRTMQTAASLVESQAAADQVAEGTGGNETGAEILEESIEVNPEGESNILAITATADSAREAARLANRFSDAVLEVRADDLREVAQELITDLESTLEATPPTDQSARADLSARLDQIRSVVKRGDPTLLPSEPAVPPASAKGASPALVVVLALLAGLVLGSGTALLLQTMARHARPAKPASSGLPAGRRTGE